MDTGKCPHVRYNTNSFFFVDSAVLSFGHSGNSYRGLVHLAGNSRFLLVFILKNTKNAVFLQKVFAFLSGLC